MNKMPSEKTKPRESRLSKTDWLRHGLEALRLYGIKDLNIDALAEYIGVTKGSFYWHFKDRSDFYKHLIKYWEEELTTSVMERIIALPGAADERLKALMELVIKEELARYDADIRAWSVYEEIAEKAVARIDKIRMGFVKSLFKEMGFSKKEAEIRSRLFYLYIIGEFMILSNAEERSKHLAEIHKFFTSK